MRFEQGMNGKWKQKYESYEKLEEYNKRLLRVEFLEDTNEKIDRQKLLNVMNEVQKSLNIISGPIFQAVLFKKTNNDSLFLVCHHLVIDGFSWRILLEDLEKAYKQANKGEIINLPAEEKNYGWWIYQLVRLSQENLFQKELDYWEKLLVHFKKNLIQEHIEEKSNIVANIQEITFELSVEETRQLLEEVSRVYKTQINDLLLTALCFVIKEWTGANNINLMLEGHGREQLTEDMDLSRTVGWFTSIYPVSFNLEGIEELEDGINMVKEYLKLIPQKGIGYGVLRYLTNEGHERLSSQKEPKLVFNYLGRLDSSIRTSSLFNFVNDPVGICISPENQRPWNLEINCQVANGNLGITLGYSIHHYQDKTVQLLGKKLIKRLKAIISNCYKEKGFWIYSFSE